MAFRPGKRKEPLDCQDQEREYSHRHCKLRISEDQIASKMLDMQLDSPEMKEVPIEFNDVRARPCNSAPCAVSTALRNCMSKFRRRQPVATRCSKVPASGLSQPAAAADQSTVEEMPTACKVCITTVEDCSDDSDSDDVHNGAPVIELSSELIRGLNAAEQLNSKLQERLVSTSMKIPQSPCNQVVLWKPPEDFIQKVLSDSHNAKGPTITEVCDEMDLSKMEVVRTGVVIEEPEEPWDCDSRFSGCEEMDLG